MKILIIQTAFLGDVILATPVIEKLHNSFPDATLDFLLRKGNETVFTGHPFLHRVICWDKNHKKRYNLARIIFEISREKYDRVINLHRFSSSGLITFLSGAAEKSGFTQNPFSFCYTKKVKHIIGNGKHEVERNLELAETPEMAGGSLSAEQAGRQEAGGNPKIYPQPEDIEYVKQYQTVPYICIAPASVWFTKQFPAHKWIELLNKIEGRYSIYLLGSAGDHALCEKIIQTTRNKNVLNLSGKLSLLQSAELMKNAVMNYVNDSAPLHLASSVNAPVTAVFCSTVPAFGFGPLSSKSFIVETSGLSCRPCGLHGFIACPQKHFKCAETIPVEKLLETLS